MKHLLRQLAVICSFSIVLAGFGGIAYWLSYQDERELSRALSTQQGFVVQSFFSPDDDLRSMLISLIDAEKKQISFAIYTLTDKAIAQALIRAAKRGVVVEGVVDRSYGQGYHSKVCTLANARIPLFVFQTAARDSEAGLMHNKFMLFSHTVDGKALVWTGSYNFTARASEKNEENVVIIENEALFAAYTKSFSRLKKRSLRISGQCTEE
jgi:phosphatidylserine/phosphatidylglycerophosphate/cardiolipin synthase-like enzyme